MDKNKKEENKKEKNTKTEISNSSVLKIKDIKSNLEKFKNKQLLFDINEYLEDEDSDEKEIIFDEL